MGQAVPALKIARHELEVWGHWWRRRERSEVSNEGQGTSSWAPMMEMLVLGVKVQKSNSRAHLMLSDAIIPTANIMAIDRFVDALPEEQRSAVVQWYIRLHTSSARSGVLLRAELAVGDRLTADHVDGWAVPESRPGEV